MLELLGLLALVIVGGIVLAVVGLVVWLVKVVFTPQTPDPANEPDVEVVFEVRRVGAINMDEDPYAVILMSSTRTDTREPYLLSEEQRDEVSDTALERVANDDAAAWSPDD